MNKIQYGYGAYGGPHHYSKTFALNTDKQVFNCERGSCGKTGNFQRLCKDFGEECDGYIEWKRNRNYEIHKTKENTYKKPATVMKHLTEKAKDYLKKRGFTEQTWENRGIACDDNRNIVMPYKDDNGNLVMLKLRPAHEIKPGGIKSWREACAVGYGQMFISNSFSLKSESKWIYSGCLKNTY